MNRAATIYRSIYIQVLFLILAGAISTFHLNIYHELDIWKTRLREPVVTNNSKNNDIQVASNKKK